MKLKILLLAIFAAGVSASLAFAEDGKPKDKGPTCKPVHFQGTIAPQSLTMTVTKSEPDGTVSAGSSLTLAVGTTGQTVRVNVEACSNGTTYTVKHLELQPMKPKHDGTTTDEHHGDKTTTSGEGEHHGDKPKPTGTTTTSGEGEHTTTSSPSTTTTP